MSSPPRLTRPERKARTREALLAAAERVFARDGFAGARVEHIAAQAGVTTGALYAHFAGKEALFLAAFEEYAAQRAREVQEAGLATADGTFAPRRAADGWMDRFDAEPWRLRLHLEFAEHARRDPHLREQLALRLAAVRTTIARLIEAEATARGRTLPLGPERLAAVVRALGIGLAAERLVDPDAIGPELYGDFVELLFELLLEERER